jgi:hypothetical protein
MVGHAGARHGQQLRWLVNRDEGLEMGVEVVDVNRNDLNGATFPSPSFNAASSNVLYLKM